MSNQQTDLFWELLANPADRSYSHVQNLRQLVSEYPQSSLLQSLLFYVGDDDQLSHAAVYTDPRLLYKLRHDAGSLLHVSDEQLIKTDNESNLQVDDAVPETAPELEIPAPAADNEPEPLIEESQPAEHFSGPQANEEHTSEVTETEPIAEPEKLDDLINYGDEVTTGEHELHPHVTEFHHPEQQEETSVDAENTPLSEHPITSHEEKQPEAEAPATEQEELPTLGFYVPGAADADDNSYSGGDISTRLYETYAETFENTPQPEQQHPIEDEVFDEIVGIDDINLASSAPFAMADDEESQPALGFEVPPEASREDPLAAKGRRVDLNDEAEKLMLSNIAATDFFVFDHALSERIKAGDEVKEAPASSPSVQAGPVSAQNAQPAIGQATAKKQEYERVAKYFDEKMPYSFMWWLDKTRKEHSGIYQPFVLDTTRNIEKNIPDELQHQYYENIFHLTSVEDLERATGSEPVVFDTRNKEDEIIERFIHEAPQIKPQTSEKLDNENKAKRSSEDQDEIVTETLAQIYTDQMLYHKAIRVYQKLMLKFPEKSLYFAGQIEQLEKKIS